VKILPAWLAMSVALMIGGAQAQTNSGSGGPRFSIARYRVEGNTLLPSRSVDKALAPFTGKDKTFATVQQALEALNNAYAKAGFSAVQVRIPEQELKDGVVRFTVVEPRLGQVIVEGNQHFSAANVRRSLPALKPGTPPRADDIARNLRTANESAAKQTRVVLRAGDKDGTVDAVARVSDSRALRVSLSLDSTGTPATGMLRAGVAVQHSNLFDRDHALSAQYVTSTENPRDVNIVGVGYRVPLYRLGDTLEFGYVYSNVNSGLVGTAAGNFGISGSGNFYTLRYNWNLPRRLELDQRISLGLDWRAFRNVALFGGTGTNAATDITLHPVSARYSAHWASDRTDLSGFLGAFHNIPGGNDGDAATFERSRAGTSPTYSLYRYGAAFTQGLPWDFQVRFSGNAQYTTERLVSGEQYGLGGMDSVRGFTEREIVADRGNRVSLEFYSPDFGGKLMGGAGARLLAFVDAGQVTAVRPANGELARESVSSAGFGLRANYKATLSFRLDYAVVMQPGGSQDRGDRRLHGVVAAYF
jgi:hemolysin activation/secretion protein